MILHRASPVISYYINGIGFHPAGRESPAVRGMDVRFFEFLIVDQEFPISEFNFFILEGNHPLQKRDFLSGETDQDNIASAGRREKITKPPAEVYLSVSIGRLHTVSVNSEGSQEMAKDQIGDKSNKTCADEEGRGQRGEKESPERVRVSARHGKLDE